MKLRAYLDSLPRGGVAAFASTLNISTVYLQQVAAGQKSGEGEKEKPREASPELCVRIEKATYGKVMRWDLRPKDWHLIWPELIGAEGAPSIPEQAVA